MWTRRFLAEILGVDPPRQVSHFMALQVANGVTLDYDDAEEFRSQHCAFLVGNDDFDAIFDRVSAARITHYADLPHQHAGEVNTLAFSPRVHPTVHRQRSRR